MCNYVTGMVNFLLNDVCGKRGVLHFKVKLRKSTDAIRFNPNLQKTTNPYKTKAGIGYEHTKTTNVSTVEDAKSGVWILFAIERDSFYMETYTWSAL